MKRTRRSFLSAAGISVTAGLAGCASDDGDDGTTPTGNETATDTATETETATETDTPTDEPAEAVVEVSSHDEYGDILVDGEGRTLYMFDSDTQGEMASTCSGDCADAWPALTTDGAPTAGSSLSAELTTFEREDGSQQVAANGWPLYYFAQDEEPGDANGQGVGNVWWVLGPDGTPKRPDVQVSTHDDYGDILVDSEGRTLYMFDRDTQGEMASVCADDCAEAWPALTVEDTPMAGGDVSAELTTFEREDGSQQVAANGWPLYYFAQDEEPGDANGQGVGNVWWVLGPDGTPKRSDVQVSTHDEYGDILVDGEGRTLYMFDNDTQGEMASTCAGDCAEAWPALTVEDTPMAGGDVSAELTTFEREDGSQQVAANGWPLYYFAQDEEPGDANGQGVGDVWWVLGPDGTPKRPDVQVNSTDQYGDILVNSEGITLYMFDSDTQGEMASACSGDCAEAWPPLMADDMVMAGSDVEAELTTFEREDGSMQVAANGWPLYQYHHDEEPGDATGQGISDVWWVLDPAGSPQRS